jgi:hypothetical protein
LCAYLAAGSAAIQERVLDISGSTITPSSAATADSTSVASLGVYVRGISASKAITCGTTATQLFIRLQGVTGSTPAATGSLLTIAHGNALSSVAQLDVVVLSTTRAAILRSIEKMIVIFIIDISGITPVLANSKIINQSFSIPANNRIYATKLDANNIYVTWTGGQSLGADGMLCTITADDKIRPGLTDENIEPGVTNTDGYLSCAALDSTHVMQVCRNASTFLSAKVLELNY